MSNTFLNGSTIVYLWLLPICLYFFDVKQLSSDEIEINLAERLKVLDQKIALEREMIEVLEKKLNHASTVKVDPKRQMDAHKIVAKQAKAVTQKRMIDQLKKTSRSFTKSNEKMKSLLKTLQHIELQRQEQFEILKQALPIQWQQNEKDLEDSWPSWEMKLLDESRFLNLRALDIHTAHGRKEKVHLLNFGLVDFAYHLRGRVGFAMNSPQAAQGYRWTEDLPNSVAQHISKFKKDMLNQDNVPIWVPIDPTGQLRIEQLHPDRTLVHQFNAGGPVMYPLLAIAAFALILILERYWYLVWQASTRTQRTKRMLQFCRDGQYDQAHQLSKSGGMILRVLEACLHRRNDGRRAMEDQVQTQMMAEIPKLNRSMGTISMLASIAPLLGLLGTVTGIIETFGVIQTFGQAKPDMMAGGISVALITTATGLLIAIPILILHRYLKGRSERLILESEKYAAELIMTLAYENKEDEV